MRRNSKVSFFFKKKAPLFYFFFSLNSSQTGLCVLFADLTQSNTWRQVSRVSGDRRVLYSISSFPISEKGARGGVGINFPYMQNCIRPQLLAAPNILIKA